MSVRYKNLNQKWESQIKTVKIHPLCGTIDGGNVPYSFLFDTAAGIETHLLWSPA